MSQTEKIIELKQCIKMLLNKKSENKKIREKISEFKTKQEEYDKLISSFMKETQKDVINVGDKLKIENKLITKVNSASKKFLKSRTLDLCDGDEEKMELIYDNLFSKDNLKEYEVKKLKVKKPDN